MTWVCCWNGEIWDPCPGGVETAASNQNRVSWSKQQVVPGKAAAQIESLVCKSCWHLRHATTQGQHGQLLACKLVTAQHDSRFI